VYRTNFAFKRVMTNEFHTKFSIAENSKGFIAIPPQCLGAKFKLCSIARRFDIVAVYWAFAFAPYQKSATE
jgi:hypothetical protein